MAVRIWWDGPLTVAITVRHGLVDTYRGAVFARLRAGGGGVGLRAR